MKTVAYGLMLGVFSLVGGGHAVYATTQGSELFPGSAPQSTTRGENDLDVIKRKVFYLTWLVNDVGQPASATLARARVAYGELPPPIYSSYRLGEVSDPEGWGVPVAYRLDQITTAPQVTKVAYAILSGFYPSTTQQYGIEVYDADGRELISGTRYVVQPPGPVNSYNSVVWSDGTSNE